MAGDGTVKLVVADVDGTLVTDDKVLTDRTVDTVQRLGEAGIHFALTSGRPPRGMEMLVGPLAVTTPLAAFNGGVFVTPDMCVIEQRTVPPPVVAGVTGTFAERGLDVWVYRGSQWLVRDAGAPHVDREAWTVRFEPTVVESFDDLTDGVAKIVGVCDEPEVTRAAVEAVREEFGDQVSAARSQPYYADVTHPDANKGAVVRYLAQHLGVVPDQIVTIGDMPNDVLMFANSRLSIAMGQSGSEVHRAARRVTASNEDEGFARAMERFVLPAS